MIKVTRTVIPKSYKDDIKKLIDGAEFFKRVEQIDRYFDKQHPCYYLNSQNYSLVKQDRWLRLRTECAIVCGKDDEVTTTLTLKIGRGKNRGSATTYDEIFSNTELCNELCIPTTTVVSEKSLKYYGFVTIATFKIFRNIYRKNDLIICVDHVIGLMTNTEKKRFGYLVVEFGKFVAAHEVESTHQHIRDVIKKTGAVYTEACGSKAMEFIRFYNPHLYEKFIFWFG